MTPVKTSEAVRAKPDTIAVAAVEPARAAAEVEAGAAGLVGEHLGHLVEGERLVTHFFASAHPGYRGWRWAVTVTRASRAKQVTIDEVVMLPGEEAIVAPEWVPWSERVQPGDLGAGDLFPTLADDPRLEPGFTDTGAPDDVLAVVEELGLGRERVLSPFGREEAAERWYAGDFGPAAPIAQAVPYQCNSCGYWIRLADSLGQAFGACANEMAPGEGRVVSYDYGCGAHSSIVVESIDHPATEHAFDTTGYDDLGPAPERDHVTPEPDDAAPEQGDAVPELDGAVREQGDAVPELDEAVPELDDAAPEQGDAVPELDDAAATADAVQVEVEAAAEPPTDDEVEAEPATEAEPVSIETGSAEAQPTEA